MNLYPILQQHSLAVSLLEESGGEITEEISQALALTQEQFTEQAVSVANVVRQIETNATAIDAEIKRLQEMKKRAEKASETIREQLKTAMIHFGIEKVDTPTLKLSFRKSVAVVVDPDKLSNKWMVEKITYTPDKQKLKYYLDKGDEIAGAYLETRQNLQIK